MLCMSRNDNEKIHDDDGKYLGKVAIFSSGDEKYIPIMIASLTIACNMNPQFEPWIISDNISEENRELLDKFKVGYMEFDLHEYFNPEDINHVWPSQSFWWAVGPESLLDLGYDYSIFIDGDILANKPIPMKAFSEDLEIAAHQCKPEGKPEQYNSGVILFNNKKMKQKRLWQSFHNCYRGMSTLLYQKWHGGKVHDQQVLSALKNTTSFSEFLGKPYDFKVEDLDILWNYRFELVEGKNEDLINAEYVDVAKHVYFVHFLCSQPWRPYKEWGSRNHGLFDGMITKDWKKNEPQPMTRVKFIENWRREVRLLEGYVGHRLFDEFDSLNDYKEKINEYS